MWERLMYLAARLRAAFSLPGMTMEQTLIFRDKELLKQAVEKAGLRVRRQGRARSVQEAWSAVERVGYPAIVKPIDGAGSKDTLRCKDRAEFERALRDTKHIAELSIEE